MQKGICYLVQEPTTVAGKPLNVTGLLTYGRELKTLLPRDQQAMTNEQTALLVDTLEQGLVSFDPQVDYLVATGDPAAIGIACAVVIDSCGWFRLLKWDKQEHTYYPVEMVIWANPD